MGNGTRAGRFLSKIDSTIFAKREKMKNEMNYYSLFDENNDDDFDCITKLMIVLLLIIIDRKQSPKDWAG